ncbi:FAD-dependent oxidoreductase [Spirillospora sp. NPDC049652]
MIPDQVRAPGAGRRSGAGLQPDFPFDYARYASFDAPLASLPEEALGRVRVAVIGAGAAGLCAAFELLRMGVVPVLYEAEHDPDGPGGRRLGGRMHSRRLGPGDTRAELGCMRFPDTGLLLAQYVDRFSLERCVFPEAFADDVAHTTVDVDGRRIAVSSPEELFAREPAFRRIHDLWREALDRVGLTRLQQDLADRDLKAVKSRWNHLLEKYETWSFQRFLTDPATAAMDPAQARLFGTAGFGTGGWDAFFDISAVEMFRLVLTTGEATSYYLSDGSAALAERWWTTRAERPHDPPASLEELHGGTPRGRARALRTTRDGRVAVTDDEGTVTYPAAVLTPQPAVIETGIDIPRTGPGAPFGRRLRSALRAGVPWPSAKIVSVSEPFWRGTGMDGVTLTDTTPRCVYTLPPPGGDGPGVLGLGYTWGRDATKLAASSLDERLDLHLRELTRIFPELADRIRDHVTAGNTFTVSWENEPNFRGICRFVRPGEYAMQRDLAAHFTKSVPGEPADNLFLAGDAVSFSAGWLDHALTSALNAVWGVAHALGGDDFPGNPGPGRLWHHPDYAPWTPDDAH